MDKVIETLNTIEERAARIMEVTDNEKKALQQEYSDRLAEYEKNARSKMEQELNAINSKLDAEALIRINNTEKEAAAESERLTEYYEKNHSGLAQQLFNSIIEVR